MYQTGLESPKGIWWKKVHRTERVWVTIAFGWCMVLFAMMPVWHFRGGQNPSGIRHRVEPAAYQARVQEFIEQYQVGTDQNIPVVEPPPGSDIYLQAAMWTWRPVLRLQAGAEYTLHLSSIDVNHGFNLYPLNINFQVVPGYDYGLRVTPAESGEFHIVCNEFCGVGHHLMVGKVIVIDPQSADAGDAAGAEAGADTNLDGESDAHADEAHTDEAPTAQGGGQ
jgi:cytochrome c oxidase subunit 2